MREYEKFLYKKGFETTKLRNNAKKHIQSKKVITKHMSKSKSHHNIRAKTKDDYKEELRNYYLGYVDQVMKYEKDLEEEGNHFFYEWTYCYVFKNPDAQSKEKWMSIAEAQSHIDLFFKPLEMENDLQKARMKHAHEEVVYEILKDMANEEGKVKKFKGGRFEKIEKNEVDKDKPVHIEEEGTKDEIDISPKWFDRGPAPKDVATLVYNIFLHKINVGLSLESQSVMSIDGTKIYVVVKADEQDLKRTAEKCNYTMQLAIGLTDLTSLEP